MQTSVDPDETPRSAASHQDLHCLLLSLLWDTEHKWVNITLRWDKRGRQRLILVCADQDLTQYCAFDIVQKVVFCLALYTAEVNLQNFIMIKCKTICRNYLCKKKIILANDF